jgi:hypothetical protein
MNKTFGILCISAGASILPLASGMAAQSQTILTNHPVELRETVSPQGFVHPGISCDAKTLATMREKVIAGVSPWVDYFEGLRRTKFADLKERPKFVSQITKDADIAAFAHDAQLAWGQTILYVVTGNEAYRKTPLEIIRWYGSRTKESFFPKYFTDSHIKIGKYVYTLCTAVDILRATTPKDARLAVTEPMVDALQKYCLRPIRMNCIQNNGYFMNQHSYAIMGYLASAILGNEVEDYRQAVEWTTVNATSANQGRNGSIKQQIRLVTHNDKTGEAVEPHLQVVEMGRDQPHAAGNIDNLLMMAKTIGFQGTKVDPVSGTVTDAKDGVSVVHFLDDRLPKGAALFAKYNLGYELPWTPTWSETGKDNMVTYDQISYFGRGSIGGNGISAGYYFYKGIGLDVDSGPYGYLKVALDATATGREQAARSGKFIDQLHNYAFDFWIGLPASASDAAPDPQKAKRALAVKLPPLKVTRDGVSVTGEQFEFEFVDLPAHAQPGDSSPGSSEGKPLQVMRDADGTGYLRIALDKDPRSFVAFSRFPRGAGLRVRSNGLVKLSFARDDDFFRGDRAQELIVPDTKGKWVHVLTTFEGGGHLYVQAAPLAGPAIIDFDRAETEKPTLRPLAFEPAAVADTVSIPTFVGASVRQVFTARGGKGTVSYSAMNLPAGAKFDAARGALSWTPSVEQVGDHALYVTARAGDTLRTLRVDIHVARDLQAALDDVARAYDPAKQYVSTTEQAFKDALKSRDLAALKKAADGLELLNPRLPDGTLDYRKIAKTRKDYGLIKMADGDPLSYGGLWGYDKNFTLDFGAPFKVKSEAFRIQARNGFPIRVTEAVVYGSNDRRHWTLLTENKARSVAEMQTLAVKKEEQTKAYRYLRFFMPAKPYPIFEIGELRIVGDRIEDYTSTDNAAYMTGYADGTFRPDQKLTKAEAVSLLAGLVDDYTDKGIYTCDFVDVPQDAPYFDDLAYMASKEFKQTPEQPVKYVTGDAQKRFHPDAPITRGELASIMARMWGLKGDGPKLRDVGANTPNAAEIRRVAREGWLRANSSGRFRPDAPVTRAEFAVAANRLIQRTQSPREGMPSFPDVSSSYWAYGDIMKAATTYPVQTAPASPEKKAGSHAAP